jgi:hypothetical protein
MGVNILTTILIAGGSKKLDFFLLMITYVRGAKNKK